MPTEITVRGTFTAFQAPERGTVHATIAFEGPAMEPVYDRVARDLEAVKASVTPLKNGDHGPVTWWSAEQLRTWSNRPWNKDGKQLPLVHHASVGVEVKFRDFAALSRWVGSTSPTPTDSGFHTSSGRSPRSGARSCCGGPHPGRRRRRHPCAAVCRRARARQDPSGRHRRRRNARRAPASGGRSWGRLPAMPPQLLAARRTSNSCRSTSRCRRRSTRGSSARTPRTHGVAFASWRNSKTGCVQT